MRHSRRPKGCRLNSRQPETFHNRAACGILLDMCGGKQQLNKRAGSFSERLRCWRCLPLLPLSDTMSAHLENTNPM
jgi:hypothetical protein